MLKNAASFPISHSDHALRCVWSLTESPNHPLVCRWLPGEVHPPTTLRGAGSSRHLNS